MSRKWQDPEVLERLYYGENKSLSEVADKLNCGVSTVVKWMDRHDIPRRTSTHDIDAPWRDEETLRRLYVQEEKSTIEIADELDCDNSTISLWLDKHGIDTRSISDSARKRHSRSPVPFRTTHQGYEAWKGNVDGKSVHVGVHRLVAVAEYGFEAVEGKLVHHKNEIPWDNRPENLQPMSRGEHNRVHIRNGK